MTVAAHPASQTRSLSLPTARRTTRALTSPHPKIRLERRPDAKPPHAHDRTGSSPSFSPTRLPVTGLRGDASDLLATYKPPQGAPHQTAPFLPAVSSLGGFRTPAPEPAQPSPRGRRPKPFAEGDVRASLPIGDGRRSPAVQRAESEWGGEALDGEPRHANMRRRLVVTCIQRGSEEHHTLRQRLALVRGVA